MENIPAGDVALRTLAVALGQLGGEVTAWGLKKGGQALTIKQTTGMRLLNKLVGKGVVAGATAGAGYGIADPGAYRNFAVDMMIGDVGSLLTDFVDAGIDWADQMVFGKSMSREGRRVLGADFDPGQEEGIEI